MTSTISRSEWDNLTPDEQYDFMCLLNRLVDSSRELLHLIPECPDHGNECIPHAKEWVARMTGVEDGV